MEYALKIKTDHTIEIIYVPEERDAGWFASKIGCNYIQVVCPKYYDDYLIVLDEDGKLKPNHLNIIASAMYATFEHGDPIVGDCLLVKEGIHNGEYDLVGLSLAEANKVKASIEHDMDTSPKFKAFISENLD